MAGIPHTVVRLDLGEVAVIEVGGPFEPDGILELAAIVRRTQLLVSQVVVDVSAAVPGLFVLDLLQELARGRKGCEPFEVRGSHSEEARAQTAAAAVLPDRAKAAMYAGFTRPTDE